MQQPAQIPRVKTQARAQQPYFAAVEADLPQQPGLAQRPLASQKMIVEGPYALGHDAVEATDFINHRVRHSLTLVSKLPIVNEHGRKAAQARASAKRAEDVVHRRIRAMG